MSGGRKNRLFESRLGSHHQGTELSTETRMSRVPARTDCRPGRYIYGTCWAPYSYRLPDDDNRDVVTMRSFRLWCLNMQNKQTTVKQQEITVSPKMERTETKIYESQLYTKIV
jgi:hypothetical protein